MCILCRSTVALLLNYRRGGMGDEEIISIGKVLCVSLGIQTEEVCDGLVDLFAVSIFINSSIDSIDLLDYLIFHSLWDYI